MLVVRKREGKENFHLQSITHTRRGRLWKSLEDAPTLAWVLGALPDLIEEKGRRPFKIDHALGCEPEERLDAGGSRLEHLAHAQGERAHARLVFGEREDEEGVGSKLAELVPIAPEGIVAEHLHAEVRLRELGAREWLRPAIRLEEESHALVGLRMHDDGEAVRAHAPCRCRDGELSIAQKLEA